MHSARVNAVVTGACCSISAQHGQAIPPQFHKAIAVTFCFFRKDDSNSKSSRVQTLALTTDATGKVRHDAVVKQQHGAGTLVQSSHTDLLSKKFTEEQLMKPSEEEVEAKADETRDALEALLQGKTGGGKIQSQVSWMARARALSA